MYPYLNFSQHYQTWELYIPKFYIKKGSGKKVNYIQMKFSHIEYIKDIKDEIRGCIVSKEVNIFPNILQATCTKEIVFFSNSHLTIDLKEL